MKALVFFCILLNMAFALLNFGIYADNGKLLNFGSGIVSMLAMGYISFILGKIWEY